MPVLPSVSSRVVVVGGGFYGCAIAAYLARDGRQVTLIDDAPVLFARASYANQARVHQGYHYPRSLVTGLSCAANFPRFVDEFRPAIRSGFEKLYAIARLNSKVTPSQFASFCRAIGAPWREAKPASRALFDPDRIEAVFEAREPVFDAHALRDLMAGRLAAAGVAVRLGVALERIRPGREDGLLELATAAGETLEADRVVLCVYSRTNAILARSGLPTIPMKLEVAEVALIQPPEALAGRGITVMDGPFFSTIPFPAEGLHSLTHVRYTPHDAWTDARRDPYAELAARPPTSRFPLMVRDAARYLPQIAQARYVRSLFEAKAILLRNEADDGRPIFLRHDHGLPGLTPVLGGKIDNIYDILEALDPASANPIRTHAAETAEAARP